MKKNDTYPSGTYLCCQRCFDDITCNANNTYKVTLLENPEYCYCSKSHKYELYDAIFCNICKIVSGCSMHFQYIKVEQVKILQ